MAFIAGQPMTIQGEYLSPIDGDFTYASAVTLTASRFQFQIDDTLCYIVSVRVRNSSNVWTTYVNGYGGINIRATSDVLTISGVTNPFAATDLEYVVYIKGQQKGYDPLLDALKVALQNALHLTSDPIPIISAAQTITASWADLGANFEIYTAGQYVCVLWIKLTIQQSLGVQVKALAKHTPAGSEEYHCAIEAVSASIITINNEIIQFPDASDLYAILVKTKYGFPYIQAQVRFLTDGGTDATIDTAYATLGY